jgi:U3 small nucleolar RNA-associated protein 15
MAVIRYSSDMYASALGQSPLIDALFLRLRRKVDRELRFQRELVSIRGALDMLLASSVLGASNA